FLRIARPYLIQGGEGECFHLGKELVVLFEAQVEGLAHLGVGRGPAALGFQRGYSVFKLLGLLPDRPRHPVNGAQAIDDSPAETAYGVRFTLHAAKIGRASCREREKNTEIAITL